jgi:hypothetical protein
MKKIIFILVASVVTLCATAQSSHPVRSAAVTTTSYSNLLDTVVNTATKVTTPWKVPGWFNGVSAAVVVTKISGTVGGTLALQGSIDGTNWVTIDSTQTASDASANYLFNTTKGLQYYRISYAGTGTMSASFKTSLAAY